MKIFVASDVSDRSAHVRVVNGDGAIIATSDRTARLQRLLRSPDTTTTSHSPRRWR